MAAGITAAGWAAIAASGAAAGSSAYGAHKASSEAGKYRRQARNAPDQAFKQNFFGNVVPYLYNTPKPTFPGFGGGQGGYGGTPLGQMSTQPGTVGAYPGAPPPTPGYPAPSRNAQGAYGGLGPAYRGVPGGPSGEMATPGAGPSGSPYPMAGAPGGGGYQFPSVAPPIDPRQFLGPGFGALIGGGGRGGGGGLGGLQGYLSALGGGATANFNPMASFEKLVPAATDRAVSQAGFGGTRYGTGAMRESARAGGEIMAQLAPIAAELQLRGQLGNLGARQGVISSYLPALASGISNQGANLRAGTGMYMDAAQLAYQDWINRSQGYLPELMGLAGGIGGPNWGPAPTLPDYGSAIGMGADFYSQIAPYLNQGSSGATYMKNA